MLKRRSAILMCLGLLILLLIFSIRPITAETIPMNGLVAYYPFNGNAKDMSGYGNNGTVYGAILKTDRFGNLGCAYSFDGVDDYISIQDAPSLRPTQITISVWQKTSLFPDPALANPWYLIARTGSDGKSGYALNVNYKTGGSCFRLFLNGSTTSAVQGDSEVANGSWNHWVGIYDGSTIKIYLNGVLEDAVNYPDGIGYAAGDPLYIGLRQLANYGTSPYRGKIDDLRIYNRALSETEISALYHEGDWGTASLAPAPNILSGMIAYYPFNGNANDASGNGNHGQVFGASLKTDRFGNPNSAFLFDGVDDYIVINDSTILRPTQITISVWAKTSFFPDPALARPWYVIARTGGAGQTGFTLNVNSVSAAPCFRLFNINSSTKAAQGISPAVDGDWNHWVGTYDGGAIKIYLNGVLEGTVSYPNGIGYISGDSLFIGRRELLNGSSPFKGKIDDIRIFNRALSQSEIMSLYHESGWAQSSVVTPTPLPSVTPLPTDIPETPTPTSRATSTQAPTPTPTNRPPALSPIGSKTVREGESLQFTVSASDPDGDPLIYSAAGLPNGATFNPVTGIFGWLPDYNQAGKPNPQVTFTVSDGNLEVSETVVILVNETIPPELISNPGFDNGIDGWHCIYMKDMNAKAEAIWDTADYDSSATSGGVATRGGEAAVGGGAGSLQVQCITTGSSYKGIQLFTGPFCLEQGKQYLLTFQAKSSERFTIPYIKLNQGAAPWGDYAVPYSGLTIHPRWQNYAAIFTANTTTANGRLTFFLGNALPDGATFGIDTVSLRQIVVYPPAEGELLANPGFDLGSGNWYFYADSSAQAWSALEAADYDSAPVSYRIECANHGNTLNSIQLFTTNLNIVQNKVYELTFKAKCSSAFAIPAIQLMKTTSPWTNYAVPYTGLTVAASGASPDWQTYTVTFTANTTASDGRITFFLGNALPDGATLLIDSVSFREVGR